jgi:hypothetical protein
MRAESIALRRHSQHGYTRNAAAACRVKEDPLACHGTAIYATSGDTRGHQTSRRSRMICTSLKHNLGTLCRAIQRSQFRVQHNFLLQFPYSDSDGTLADVGLADGVVLSLLRLW